MILIMKQIRFKSLYINMFAAYKESAERFFNWLNFDLAGRRSSMWS